MAATGARLGTGYIAIRPDFSRFQEHLGRKLSTALAPAGERAGKDLGRNLARGMDRGGGLKQAFAPILRRFDKFGDEAGKSIAAKVGKGSKQAAGDMFGLADAVKEVERRSKASSRAAKSLGGDMFGVGKAAKASGKQIHSVSSQLSAWHARANTSGKVAKKLGDGIREMGSDFSSVVRKLRVGSGDFSGFNGAMSRINRTFSFFGNILRTLKLPAFFAALGLTAQALSALAVSAIAATSALGPLSGLLVTFPAGALAAAQAFGALKLATAGIGDAVKAAFKVQTAGGQQAIDVLRQQEAAAEAVADAEKGLADAQHQSELAQTSLNEARTEARRELQDLRVAAKEAHDAEQEGNLSLVQARKELEKTLGDPKATGLDIRLAEEAVDRAETSLERIRLEAKRARQDNADAQRKGVEESKGVVAAKEAVADANEAEEQAERDLTKAIRDQTDALKDQGSAATALQEKMAELPPAARKFAKFLIGLKPRLDALRETAAAGFFPGAEKGIKSALKNFGVFKGIISETSKALGRVSAKAGAKLGSEAWGRDLGKLGALNTRILERMGDATLNVADAFRNILVSAEPFLDWLSEGTVKFSEWIKDSSQAGRESGRLSHFFDETRKTMERVWPILKGVGGALLNIGKAAKPLGDEILESLGKSAEGWRKWTGSLQGQNELKRYFRDVKPAVWEVGRLVRDASTAFFELGKQKGVANLLRLVRTGLIPAIRDLAGASTGFLSGFLGDFATLRRQGVPLFDAFLDVLVSHAGEAGLRLVKALVNAVLHASILGKLAIGGWLISKFGGKGALLKAGAGIGRWLGLGLGSGVSETVASTIGSGGSTGIAGRLKGIKWRRIGGLGLGAILADGVLNEYQRFTDEHSNDLLTALGAKGDTQSGVEKTLTGGANFLGIGGKIDLPSFSQIFGNGFSKEQEAAQNLKAEFEEMAKTKVRLSESTIQSLRNQAEEVDLTKEARAQLERMLTIAEQGNRLGIKVGLNSEGQIREIHKYLKGLDLLKSGVITRLGDISEVAKENLEHISASFKTGTPKWRKAIVDNMKASIDAIRTGMKEGVIETDKGQKRIAELTRNIRLFEGRDPTGLAKGFSEGWAKAGKITEGQIEKQIDQLRKLPKGAQEQAREAMVRMARKLESERKLPEGAASKLNSALTTTFGQTNRQLATSTAKTMAHIAEAIEDGARGVGAGIENVFENMAGALAAMGAKKIPKFSVKILGAASQYHHARENAPEVLRQKGGPVPTGFALGGLAATVPGNSTGDRHVLSLNGRPVAKVESREGIFVGNRKMMAAAKAANDAVPRFQKGGLVRGGFAEPKLEGQGGALKQLGQSAIHKVFEGAKGYLDKQKAAVGPGGPLGSMAASGSVGDHPELQPGISAIAATVLKRFPELIISSTLRPGDSDSFHSLGRAIDLASSSSYMLKAAAWIRANLGRNLTEGIHNPNLSIDSGNEVPASFWGSETWAGHLDHIHLAKQRGGFLGLVKRLRSGGYLGNINHLWAEHNSANGDWGGPTLPSYVVAALAEAAGDTLAGGRVPGVEAEQITRGESGSGKPNSARPGATGVDPGGTKGWGLWMTTTTFNDAVAAKLGGYSKLLNPVRSAAAMALTWPGVYYGDKYVTSRGAHYTGNYDIRDALGGATFKQALEGKAPGPEAGSEGGGKSKAPAEKVPPTYKGAKTGPLDFKQPKTLQQVNDELREWEGKLPIYRKARRHAEDHGKPATAKALAKNVGIIEQRIAGLRSMRTKLRLAAAKDRLKKRIQRRLTKLGVYDQRIEASQRLYEKAAEFAGQVVALEPESPELAAEPELEQNPGESDKAFEKRRRDARNAYEQQREASERDYVSRFAAYVEGQERPAYGAVFERIADWRNDILRAETFGFGDKQPSANAMQTGWEGRVRTADYGIDQINDFTQKVKERVDAYREQVKKEVEKWRSENPGKPLPDALKKRQEDLPQELKDMIAERDRLRSQQLPRFLDEDSQLRTAIGEARESFFAGGDNRIGPNGVGVKGSQFAKNATFPKIPLAGSGSFEGYLQDVQGIHIYPEQHELLGADALVGSNDPGRFGGVIWDMRETLKELGLKIKSAASSVQKASFEKEGEDSLDSNDSERVALLEGRIREILQGQLVGSTLGKTIAQFNASYPFAGTFHTGGVIPGPSNAEAMALVRGGEVVFTPEQMEALGSSSGAAISPEDIGVHLHGDLITDRRDPVEIVIGDQRHTRRVEEISRGTSARGRVAVR